MKYCFGVDVGGTFVKLGLNGMCTKKVLKAQYLLGMK